MNRMKAAGLLPALLLVGNTALAEGPYLGAKVGLMDPDISGLDEATNVGLVAGYSFADNGSNMRWGVEAEFTTTTSDGDVRVGGLNGDWDVDTQALYGVLTIGDTLYGKLRLGYLREDVSVSLAGFSADGNDDGVSGGVGAGWRVNDRFALEAEYTFVEQDIDFYSLGVTFAF